MISIIDLEFGGISVFSGGFEGYSSRLHLRLQFGQVRGVCCVGDGAEVDE